MKRLALPALSVVVAFSASFAADGKALFQQKGCTACHQPSADTAGPALKKIAAAYAGKKADLIKFLNDIAKMPRLINLDEVEFMPQQKDEKIILKANFNTYKYTGVKLEQKKK